mmetsp:Transcript_82649/g.134009  ORF Transcript_82649/g.134009 Transcript_82649/m.134009 type:complete len:512 (-) Transcript_82649:271-1806(-)
MFSGKSKEKPVEESAGASDDELGPMTQIDVPNTFQGWCSLISRVLAPAEELSPFKLGQIQKLIGDINADAGLFVAPGFVMGQIVFLIAFTIYLVVGIIALVADFGAAEDSCAADSWVWIFVLLALAIPTGLGFVMGLVKTGLNMANLKKRFGWDVPPALLSFPGPVLYVVLGVLGIMLWVNMTDACASSYAGSYFLLFIIFKIQVIMFGIAAIFGAITTFSQTVVFINNMNPEDPDLTALKKTLNEAEESLQAAERDYVSGAEQIVSKLKKQVADAERERDDAKAQLKKEEEFGEQFSFGEMSSLIVKHLSPVEELSPFKLGQVQELIGQIHKETGDLVAPYFAVAIVFFLLLFCAYLAGAIVALVLDFAAMDAACAADSWVWLYVLLAVVIPTSLGFVMGVVKAALIAADLKERVGWEIPPVALALPGPILYIVLGVLGIVLWVTMDASCKSYYTSNAGLLFIVFKVQVVLMAIASVFGIITCVAQASVLFAQLSEGREAEEETADIKSA